MRDCCSHDEHSEKVGGVGDCKGVKLDEVWRMEGLVKDFQCVLFMDDGLGVDSHAFRWLPKCI